MGGPSCGANLRNAPIWKHRFIEPFKSWRIKSWPECWPRRRRRTLSPRTPKKSNRRQSRHASCVHRMKTAADGAFVGRVAFVGDDAVLCSLGSVPDQQGTWPGGKWRVPGVGERALGIQEGSSPALVREVGRQVAACCPRMRHSSGGDGPAGSRPGHQGGSMGLASMPGRPSVDLPASLAGTISCGGLARRATSGRASVWACSSMADARKSAR